MRVYSLFEDENLEILGIGDLEQFLECMQRVNLDGLWFCLYNTSKYILDRLPEWVEYPGPIQVDGSPVSPDIMDCRCWPAESVKAVLLSQARSEPCLAIAVHLFIVSPDAVVLEWWDVPELSILLRPDRKESLGQALACDDSIVIEYNSRRESLDR
jgi:hypothetical protein